jgi:hypothetical protein
VIFNPAVEEGMAGVARRQSYTHVSSLGQGIAS